MNRIITFAAVAALAALAGQASAQPAAPAAPITTVTTVGANLNISPKRVTLDRNRRSATVYIYNQGNGPGTFDISMIDRVMLPDGQIVAVSDAQAKPEQKAVADKVKSAQSVVLVSPRRATLAPGQGQTIRLRMANLPEGADASEFRTHLTITTIPPATSGVTAESAAGAQSNELRFDITSVFGLSIPAIVRTGAVQVQAGVENARIEHADISPDGAAPPRRTPILVMDLVRSGPNSLFGNIEAKTTGKQSQVIGVARGVGVYTEIDRRVVRIPLQRELSAGEKLEITFTDDDASPGKVLAKQVL
ncbi:hypothetical protein [Phenylobacterium deserti]|uniref:Molecular chaperone n=1 Tax=Phenylobacterium deserti TaxID=1914756 RepID=A0A328ADP7_9CAUL|nr:hypothetical protein [Phenylobacterium deserti]RAK50858.1 hypothetical protein DJ018_16935 [Phenylobacterium deserti]